jgi:CubicO group peptidase (beta-lactamase class C family)
MVTYGFILGELVQRVTGEPVAERLARELLRPLGLRDIHLGLPAGTWSRRVPVTADRPRDRARGTLFNLRRTRQAVIPAAGISASARDLVTFYRMLLGQGSLGDAHVLRPGVIAEATRESCDGETDQVLGRPVRYAHGFQLGSPGRARAMGELASPDTFGHNGSNICNVWADPSSGIAFAYLTSRIMRRGEGARHHAQVSDGIRAASVG